MKNGVHKLSPEKSSGVILVGTWVSFLGELGTIIQHGTKWMRTKVLLPNEEFLPKLDITSTM